MPSEEELRRKLLGICEDERRSIEDAFASAIIQANRKLDLITANPLARARVDKIWSSEDARLAVVSGKTALSELSKWTQTEFGVAFGAQAVARQMRQSEIPSELSTVLNSIEEGSNFPGLEERITLQ